MEFRVVESLVELGDAWRLVYREYLRAGLIEAGQPELFVFPAYLSNEAAVVTGGEQDEITCTVSAVLDGPGGLPLDEIFRAQLDALRVQGRQLIEIGLLARTRRAGGLSSTVELVNHIARFGTYAEHLDYVVGIHPRRAPLFRRLWGFQTIGETTRYARLNTAPVVLCHLDGRDPAIRRLALNQRIIANHDGLHFERRFKFHPSSDTASRWLDLTSRPGIEPKSSRMAPLPQASSRAGRREHSARCFDCN